jgi:hypothetical protein
MRGGCRTLPIRNGRRLHTKEDTLERVDARLVTPDGALYGDAEA